MDGKEAPLRNPLLVSTKRICLLDPDFQGASSEAYYLFTIATEHFVKIFTKLIFSGMDYPARKTMKISDVESCIRKTPFLKFLDGAIDGWDEVNSRISVNDPNDEHVVLQSLQEEAKETDTQDEREKILEQEAEENIFSSRNAENDDSLEDIAH